MTDTTTRQRLTVETNGGAGPYIVLPLAERHGDAWQWFADGHRKDLVIRRIPNPPPGAVDQNQIVRWRVQAGSGILEGHVFDEPLSLAQQIDLDQVGGAFQHFALLLEIGPPIRAGPFVGRTGNLDQRDELMAADGIADFNHRMLKWFRVNGHGHEPGNLGSRGFRDSDASCVLAPAWMPSHSDVWDNPSNPAAVFHDTKLGPHDEPRVVGSGQAAIETPPNLSSECIMKVRPDVWCFEVRVHSGKRRWHRQILMGSRSLFTNQYTKLDPGEKTRTAEGERALL